MKRYIHILLLVCGSLFLGSCDSWLDVQPYDKIGEEDLFSSEEGFQRLLNGVYVELNDDNLYGSSLTVELIEVMGGAYQIGSDRNQWEDYVDLANYTYNTTYWKDRFDQVWDKAYALVMNCNKILDNIESRQELFSETNYDIIRGEALALRAMLQFDMLRIFGPVYSRNPENISIPYYEHQTTDIADRLPASQVLEKVIADLIEAEKLLANDPIITQGTMMSPAEGNESTFLRYRALRLNYYAVQGLLARVYLYAGNKTSAFDYATKVIQAAETGVFPFVDPADVVGNPTNIDRIFSSEVLFALTNVNRVNLFKNYHDPNRYPDRIFTMEPTLLDELIYTPELNFGGSKNDYRYIANWKTPNISSVTNKCFYKYDDMPDNSVIENTMIPMLRLGEMYLIAAESQSDDLGAGLSYVNELRSHRGLTGSELDRLTNNRLAFEYIRELYGEGQLFFFYKRTYSTIYSYSDYDQGVALGTSASDAVFVVPMPDTEMNNRQ